MTRERIADAVNEKLRQWGVTEETRRRLRRSILDDDREELGRWGFYRDWHAPHSDARRIGRKPAVSDGPEAIEAWQEVEPELKRLAHLCDHCERPLTVEHLLEGAEQGFTVGVRRVSAPGVH